MVCLQKGHHISKYPCHKNHLNTRIERYAKIIGPTDLVYCSNNSSECKHVHHVSSQLPYALTVAGVSFLTFVVAGFTQSLGVVESAFISWACGITLLAAALAVLKKH